MGLVAGLACKKLRGNVVHLREQIKPRNSVFLFDLQHFDQEGLGEITDGGLRGYALQAEWLGYDVIQDHLLVCAIPGLLVEEHHKKGDSQAPDIAFAGVLFLHQDLRAHIVGGAQLLILLRSHH